MGFTDKFAWAISKRLMILLFFGSSVGGNSIAAIYGTLEL
jgi:hypothetical protein